MGAVQGLPAPQRRGWDAAKWGGRQLHGVGTSHACDGYPPLVWPRNRGVPGGASALPAGEGGQSGAASEGAAAPLAVLDRGAQGAGSGDGAADGAHRRGGGGGLDAGEGAREGGRARSTPALPPPTRPHPRSARLLPAVRPAPSVLLRRHFGGHRAAVGGLRSPVAPPRAQTVGGGRAQQWRRHRAAVDEHVAYLGGGSGCGGRTALLCWHLRPAAAARAPHGWRGLLRRAVPRSGVGQE
mmetsp:Transcript_832/g.1467  ORF Transcript_832/g.1467 Transcript_832/m.1467 type:complete len:240 (+) Transcript_832:746-1465(+)